MWVLEGAENHTMWEWYSKDNKSFPVEDFESSRVFDGKSFWEVEQEIEWVDE